MNKQELIRKVADNSELNQKQAGEALDTILGTIVEAVAHGEKIQLVGFGTFEAKKREARIGRNPRTKEAVEIPASITPVFKAGKAFKESMNS